MSKIRFNLWEMKSVQVVHTCEGNKERVYIRTSNNETDVEVWHEIAAGDLENLAMTLLLIVRRQANNVQYFPHELNDE